MNLPSYCVVGGGISGLTAAYRLREAAGEHARITLFDPGDRLGGVLRTEQVAGRPMDLGAEAFVLRRPEMPALLAELGLSGRQLATTGARPRIYSGQRLHPLPSATIVGIPSSSASLAGLVDDATIARIDAEPARRAELGGGQRPRGGRTGGRPVRRADRGPLGGSAAERGVRGFGGNDRAARGGPDRGGGLDRGATSLTDAVRQGLPPVTGAPVFGALGGGYRTLIDELVGRSRARWVRAAVQRLEPAGSGWALRDDTGQRWEADAVVLAIQAPRLARLLEGSNGLSPRACAAASRITSASSVVVALAVPGDTPLPGVRVCWWPAENRCGLRRSPCRHASGAWQVMCSSCGCRLGGSATIWPPVPPTRSCWLGLGKTWPPCSGWRSNP